VNRLPIKFCTFKKLNSRKCFCLFAQVLHIVTCCRPFSIADGDGFKDLAKQLVSIGATYGEIDDIDQILPCATTVSRHLGSAVATSKSTLKQVFQTASYHFVIFVTDPRSL
jgi:hypothetical protein